MRSGKNPLTFNAFRMMNVSISSWYTQHIITQVTITDRMSDDSFEKIKELCNIIVAKMIFYTYPLTLQ